METQEMSRPYTDEEIQSILAHVRTYESYDPVADDISGEADIRRQLDEIGYKRTPVQVQAILDYNRKHFGGHVSLKNLECILLNRHKPSLYASFFAHQAATNNDGIISKEEFENIYELTVAQWPSVGPKTYEDFVKETDTNNSGEVDILEFVSWIESHSNQN